MALVLTARIPFYKEIIRENDFNKHNICHHNLLIKQTVFDKCSNVLLLESASWGVKEKNVVIIGKKIMKA